MNDVAGLAFVDVGGSSRKTLDTPKLRVAWKDVNPRRSEHGSIGRVHAHVLRCVDERLTHLAIGTSCLQVCWCAPFSSYLEGKRPRGGS